MYIYIDIAQAETDIIPHGFDAAEAERFPPVQPVSQPVRQTDRQDPLPVCPSQGSIGGALARTSRTPPPTPSVFPVKKSPVTFTPVF